MNTAKAYLFPLFFIPLFLFSQNESSVKWGPFITKKKSHERNKIVAQLEDGFISMRRFKKIGDKKGEFLNDQFELSKFSRSGELISQNVLELKTLSRNPEFLEVIYFNGKLIALYEHFEANYQNYIWECRIIDPSSLKFVSKRREISRVREEEDFEKRTYSLKVSPDESFLLIYKEDLVKKGYKLKLFTAELEKIKDYSFGKEAGMSELGSGSIILQNSGRIYFGHLFDPPKSFLNTPEKSQKKLRSKFNLYKLDWKTSLNEKYTLGADSISIVEMKLRQNPMDEVYAVGLYAQIRKPADNRIKNLLEEVFVEEEDDLLIGAKPSHGIISYKLSELDGREPSPRIEEFSESLADENISDSRIKNELGLADYHFRALLPAPNSGFYLLLERFSNTERTPFIEDPFFFDHGPSPMHRKVRPYTPAGILRLDNIILIYLNESGEVNWHRTLAKSQKLNSTKIINEKIDYDSFFYSIDEQHLFLIFNDGPINYEHREKGWLYSKPDKMEIISLLKIRKESVYEQEVIEEASKSKFRLVPDCFSTFEASKNQKIIYAENARGYKWGFLK